MHKPVLLQEVIDALQPRAGGDYIDATVGAGGHTAAILTASAPDGRVYGFDRDREALDVSRIQLDAFGDRVHLLHANFDQLAIMASRYHLPRVDGLLLDLGVSSLQLDRPRRGFSFQLEGPIDMRMDSTVGQPAATLVNQLPEKALADLIYTYGEEPHSRRIARAIVRVRPLQRTTDLANVVAKAVPARPGRRRGVKGKKKIHPATRTFQALRIAVNDELGALERVLPQALDQLRPGGRLAVISFNSLEDRIVKRYFKRESQDCICPPEHPICTCEHKATINIITKKPITPSGAEISENPKARSAKLRVVELREGKYYVK